MLGWTILAIVALLLCLAATVDADPLDTRCEDEWELGSVHDRTSESASVLPPDDLAALEAECATDIQHGQPPAPSLHLAPPAPTRRQLDLSIGWRHREAPGSSTLRARDELWVLVTWSL